MFKVLDWYGNDVGSPLFDNMEDAHEWLMVNVSNVYGSLDDDSFDEQCDEYQIVKL